MSEYTLTLFGMFDDVEIEAIVDDLGAHWFTQDVVARSLDMDRTSVGRLRSNNPSEFVEGDEWQMIVFARKRRVVYSEEGFLTVCDLARTGVAYRLRRWMRKQFRVKREGRDVRVYAKTVERDDFSDLGPDLVLAQTLVDTIAAERRRVRALKLRQTQIAQEQKVIQGNVLSHERRLSVIEEAVRTGPGEMTATQMAGYCRWHSSSGAVHNTAVILAAINERFDERTLMVIRHEKAPSAYGRAVQVWVFTPEGVAEFKDVIDSRYHSGQRFTIEPNEYARSQGAKNKRHVFKS